MPGKTHRIGPNVIDVSTTFATEEACAAYLEAARWPNGVRCPKCDHDKVSKFTTNETSRHRVNAKGERITVRVPSRQLYQCLNKECKYQFSVTEGTIFNDTHLPLNKWFMATALMLSAKKGVSAKQMERHLDISYKTAWYLCHRIRKAMEGGNPGLLTGVVECDETISADAMTNAANALAATNRPCSARSNAIRLKRAQKSAPFQSTQQARKCSRER